MAKCVVNADGSGFLISYGSSGSAAVVFTQASNPDGSKVKDTRK